MGIWWSERQGFEARRGKSRKQKWNRFGRKSNRFGMDANFCWCEGNVKVKVMILDCTTTLSSECLIVLLLSYRQFSRQHRLNRQLYWDPSLYSIAKEIRTTIQHATIAQPPYKLCAVFGARSKFYVTLKPTIMSSHTRPP